MIVDLEQGTPEWLDWRKTRRCASESAALLRVALYPPKTPHALWEAKTGVETPVNYYLERARTRGRALEPVARALYESERSELMVPWVVDGDGGYGASLDGLSFHGGRILEVKCPFFGTGSKLWKQATAGKVPKHAAVQVQHQLMASGAELADFAVYAWDVHALTIIEVRHDLAMQARIRAAWDAFWPDYAAGRAPGEDYVSLLKRSIVHPTPQLGGILPLDMAQSSVHNTFRCSGMTPWPRKGEGK
jgi:putative phage-type endonuclease